ncbi:MAG: hypothetical protein A2508_09575 [Candidatus Lambdaproteobacteria bacterium RIFOXYD12_FULL_49_8]|uniref:Guanylate cyclase domain-containing protein n=1 Tax=Candidatus Lambdaproteobacteria bacterium RIFOXYD2_FULL_50_16 TaxID=1817772 RepID=A0A1F6GF54_9PROT|nr:MAG: hypothetical protein A2527_04105 [Candidatus Lambdaproteobacteria bacterium RIFOXYD2_FULL_50_16]OGG97992.1 MAG: hypothetical protein A2508_09575 [Candidatus Lambdaproteobacteria bacterium RIFOXYD12_FULL_49_8]
MAAKKKKKQSFAIKDLITRYDVWAAIILFLLMIPAERQEWFSTLENQTLSVRHILRNGYAPAETTAFAKDKIAIVNLDEPFFKEYGSFPLRRADVGKMAEKLATMGAKVVMIDMLMDFPSSYGEDPIMAESLKQAENTILVSMLKVRGGKIEGISQPAPTLLAATATAYSNHTEMGNMLNRLRLYPEAAKNLNEWPCSVLAAAWLLGTQPKFNDAGQLVVGDKVIQLDQFGDFRIDYSPLGAGMRFLTQDPFVGIPAMDLYELDMEEEDDVEDMARLVKDKIVFIGDTSEVSHDIFNTLVGEVYGVEVMAYEVSTILKGAPLKSASAEAEAAMILIFMVFLIGFHFISDPKLRFPALTLLFFGYFAFCSFAYVNLNLVFSMSYLLIAAVMGTVFINIHLFIQERKQKSFITGAFGQYLSPAVIEALVEDPSRLSLGGERRVMTAYFSDVQGFSTISESLTPEELVHLLNYYLTDMCELISKHDGTVDKFEGDAIIAFWGAPLEQPDHATRACHAAIDMQERLIAMREQLKAEGRPLLHVRQGINTGPMVVGNMGSQNRMDYTMMGDSVNLAARLEGANKFYKNFTMISHFTYEEAKDNIDVRELDVITVVGKDLPITVYDLLARKNQTPGQKADLVEAYLKALQVYKDRRFKDAAEMFKKALEIDPKDGPSITYFERCKHLILNPPAEDWNGVWKLTEKG